MDKPVVLVDYEPSKSGETAYGLLELCCGYLVCDATANFNKSIARNGLTPVLCNDHARRRFTNIIKRLDKKLKTKVWVANKAIDYYKALYRLERTIANDSIELKAQRWQAKSVYVSTYASQQVSLAQSVCEISVVALYRLCLDDSSREVRENYSISLSVGTPSKQSGKSPVKSIPAIGLFNTYAKVFTPP